MMKSHHKILTIVVLCFAAGTMKAQSISGVSLSFAIPDSYDGMILSPNAKLDANNHTWSVGPTVLFSFGDQIEQRDNTKLTGLYLGYANHPQGRDEKISMFYGFDLWAQRIRDEQDSRFFDTSSNTFQDITIEQKDNVLQFFVNAGLRVNLSSQFSVNQSIGTGLNATFRSTSSPFTDFTDAFYNQDWQLKTSLTFYLK